MINKMKEFLIWLFSNKFERELQKEVKRIEEKESLKSIKNKYDFHCAICGDVETIELQEAPQSKTDDKGNLLFECYTCYFAGAVLRGDIKC